MANAPGDFIWYELLATDTAAAARFYSRVIGWRITDASGAVPGYHEIAAPDASVGGMMAISPEMARHGARAAWVGYVGVADVDAAVARWQQGGGSVLMPAWDIPGIGRLAMLADPHGVPLYVMRGASDGTSTAFVPEGVGHCNWNQLATPDPAGALAFYGSQFGWKPGGTMPMGEAGDYLFIEQGGAQIGGIMKPWGGAPPHWTFFFGVDDVDAVVDAVRAEGGTVLSGPDEVPGGAFTVTVRDPEGAVFGVVGGRGAGR